MVPVKISLSNFLSYGEEVQTLDFSRFRVACLSGKNGQGKSALLDALTWALWGEARKSSGAQKPDEELIRIGSRRMSVDFVFDIEGERYRVLRGYSRSASGKTSKSQLELQLIGEGERIIPLTGTSIKETQQKLNECLGLDYDAFVNSSMLLQGRSDEFTKKRPTERKNILGRILNLSRYDRLADRAKGRQSSINIDVEKVNHEIEILSKSIEDEISWKESLQSVSHELEEHQQILDDLQKSESSLSKSLGALQALSGEFDSITDSIENNQSQRIEREKELSFIVEKINAAEKLLSAQEVIQKEYEQYLAFLKERDELDSIADVYRGIDKQLEATQTKLAVERSQLEGAIKQLDIEIRHKEQVWSELNSELGTKDDLERRLGEARAAEVLLKSLTEKYQKRGQLKEKVKDLEKKVSSERTHIQGSLEVIEEELATQSDMKNTVALLQEEIKKIAHSVKELEEVRNELSVITEHGQSLGDKINQIEFSLIGLEKQKKQITTRIDQLNEKDGSTCPACGTFLDEEKINSLAGKLNDDLAQATKEESSVRVALNEATGKRELLREKFKDFTVRANLLSKDVNRELQLKERLLKAEESQKRFEVLKEKQSAIKARLQKGEFAFGEKEKIEELNREITAIEIDEEQFKSCQFQAAQIDRFEEKMRSISFAEGKKEHLDKQLVTLREKSHDLRRKLDTGEAFASLKEEINTLNLKLKGIGFDPGRYDFIKDKLKKGREIPDKMKDLVNAKKNQDEWNLEQSRLRKIILELEESLKLLNEKQNELGMQIASGEHLQDQLNVKKRERENAEERIKKLQQNKGKISARLQQIKEAKSALTTARVKLKESKAELNIYRKLRTAFGKNGIQSLIIEQALPEIEERASEILFRLTEGKMQVHLETIKDKKSGGTKETLEIIITDDQGVPRSYETFSGGEAFRINFALRIALSQILAERSGVRIRTLGIDEGFGTQDEEGVQYLIEAIQEVQDDFEKIIVITHLERLKEAFPVRIEVVKDPIMGSQLTMIEH